MAYTVENEQIVFDDGTTFDGGGGSGSNSAGAQPSSWNAFTNWLSSPQGASIAGNILNIGGGMMNANAAQNAANQYAATMGQQARNVRFRPVNVTTNFGNTNFQYGRRGQLTGAGYTLSPEMQAQQDYLTGKSGTDLTQFGQAIDDTDPMRKGAQGMFNIGQQYMAESPEAAAQQWMAGQQNVLASSRAKAMADLQAQMQAQGRGGFAIGGDAGMGASNPQLQALLNAQLQQDRELAANADQYGRERVKFGAGMLGLGGDMLKNMYGTQVAAGQPYFQTLQAMQGIEGLGRDALGLGAELGGRAMTGAGNAAALIGQGAQAQMNTAQQVGSPWGNIMQGAGQAVRDYGMWS